jgi:phage gp46-like protein
MIDLRGTLGNDAYESLMRGVARGRYQVLLGAGSSATSLDRDGHQLPGGSTLREDIVQEFRLPLDSNSTLKRVYQQARQGQSKSALSVGSYLKRRFTETQPASWHEKFLKLQWKQLWTLNIDDCVEVASNKLGNQGRQRLVSISWTDRHRQADLRHDELLLVHLHGKASRGNRDDELIFDIASYVNSLSAQHRWLKIFGDEFPANPFLIIGASLEDEIDLQAVLEEGRLTSSAEHPSLIVLRSISEFQRAEYKSYGLVPIASTAEEFVDAVYADLHNFLEDLAPQALLESAGVSPETMRFLAQWRSLDSHERAGRDDKHDLYLGHEPRWSDAVRGRISKRAVAGQLVNKVTVSLPPGKHAVVLAYGESFSGKSSLILQSCLDLIAKGYLPFLFVGEQAIDAGALLHWLQRVPKTVLVIDDASDFARDIQDLLDDDRASDVSVRIVMVERLSRSRHVKTSLIDHQVIPVLVPPALSASEIGALVQLLQRRKRLGILTPMKVSDRVAYFDAHDRKLFSSMAALEDGRGFKARITEVFDHLSSTATRRLLVTTALANRLGYPLPLEIVKTSAGLSVRETERFVEDELSDLLLIEDSKITSRHKIFGELLVEHLECAERREAIVDLALSVAPHVSPAAITDSSLYYRIARSLMGKAMLLELLSNNHDEALQVYERLEDAYAWNARYWEQRALTASDSQRFEPAFSWAQQAVAKRRDSYSLNTIGVVLMQRAVYEAQDGTWPTDTFEKAHDYLEEARKLEGSRAEYPIDTFFTYVTRLMLRVPVRDKALNQQISMLWSTWYTATLLVDAPGRLRLQNVMADASHTWEREGLSFQ